MTHRTLAQVAAARRRYWSLIALIALLLAPLADATAQSAGAQPGSAQPAGAQPLADAEPLRVLSYNIRHCRGLDDQLDLPRIAAVIRSVSPDLVALQEVDQHVQRSGGVDQLAELAKLTGMHGVFGANIDLQGGKYGNAILSRFPITDSHNQLLPSFDDGEQRGVLSATVQAPEPLGDLTLLATHLDFRRDPRERLASVDAIAELLAKRPGLPTLLAGDMNAQPDSDTLQRLADHWQPTNTGTLPTIPAAAPKRQIDFILTAPADGWEVIETRVLDEPVASDHRPVFSVLRWRAGESPVNQATAGVSPRPTGPRDDDRHGANSRWPIVGLLGRWPATPRG